MNFNDTKNSNFCEQDVVITAFISLIVQWVMLPFGILVLCLDQPQIQDTSLQSRLQCSGIVRVAIVPTSIQQRYGTIDSLSNQIP